MADAYWRVTDGRIQPVSLPPVASKRPRTEYDVPSGPEIPGNYSHNNAQGMHHTTDPIESSYERYLRCGQNSSYAGGESVRSMSNGVINHPVDGPRVMGTVGSEPVAPKSRTIGFGGGRPEARLPPDASSTLFVEGLPANCTRREVSHVFRPFVGYKEVRLVIKEPRHPGGNPLVLCFVDFVRPAHAATAMDTLQVGSKSAFRLKHAQKHYYDFAKKKGFSSFLPQQGERGYKFDEHDRDSANLRLQFARRPGARSGGWHRGNH